MNLRTYENDKAIIPDEMEPNLSKYDIGDEINGDIKFTVDKKDAKQITLCITSINCYPQKRMTEEKE